jgi:hypothetical protein
MRSFVFALLAGLAALIATPNVAVLRGAPVPADEGTTQSSGSTQTPVPAAVRAVNDRFAGVWKLVGEETRDAKGQTVSPRPYAADGGRFGYIVYDPAGYVGVTISWPVRPKFAGPQPTPEEALTAMATYNSYWGSFAVNEARGIVTHQTFGALSPSFAGTNQERGYTFAGNRLTLRPPTATNGDQRTLTWERVPDLPNLTTTHRRLIGFWKLISFERRVVNGEVVQSNPGQTGFIVYTASGHVMVHMMQPYRRRNVGPSPTPEETMATYRTYTSYFGPYTVNESEGYLVHHLVGALNPGLVGSDFRRFFQFSGKRLTLQAPVTTNAKGESVQSTIIWERLSE